jgi:hypothetical protein
MMTTQNRWSSSGAALYITNKSIEKGQKLNNNTKHRWKKLTKAQRVALAKAGEVRKSKHAKVAWDKSYPC